MRRLYHRIRWLLGFQSFSDQIYDFVESVRRQGSKVDMSEFKTKEEAMAWLNRDRGNE